MAKSAAIAAGAEQKLIPPCVTGRKASTLFFMQDPQTLYWQLSRDIELFTIKDPFERSQHTQVFFSHLDTLEQRSPLLGAVLRLKTQAYLARWQAWTVFWLEQRSKRKRKQ